MPLGSLIHASGWVRDLTIPLFTAIIGYVTNWTGVWMLFHPIEFRGVRLPGLKLVTPFMPRRLQEVPMGLHEGRFGWQGIIPSRAGKMGSIAVDKGLSKLASQRDFYEQLEPDKIAEQMLANSRDEVRAMVEQLMEEHRPTLWRNLPPQVREAIHARVQEQLPEVVHQLTDAIGENIDQLFDVKLMVIRAMEQNPALLNRMFQEVGARELRMIINFGAIFGGLLGVPLVFLTQLAPQWWVVPVAGVVIGWVTNYLAILLIFEPVEARHIGPFKFQGLFIQRQPEVADVYAGIIADDVLTLPAIGNELLNGPRGDRTRAMVASYLRPAVDKAVGPARAAARLAVGAERYESIREEVVTHGTGYAFDATLDPVFASQQSANIRQMMSDRMRRMTPGEFSELLRSAIKQDEWLLFLHGAVLGLGAGLLHALLFG